MNKGIALRKQIVIDAMLATAKAYEPDMDHNELRDLVSDAVSDTFAPILKAEEEYCDRSAARHREHMRREALLAAE